MKDAGQVKLWMVKFPEHNLPVIRQCGEELIPDDGGNHRIIHTVIRNGFKGQALIFLLIVVLVMGGIMNVHEPDKADALLLLVLQVMLHKEGKLEKLPQGRLYRNHQDKHEYGEMIFQAPQCKRMHRKKP